jgi:hypothetical protein
MQLTLAANHTVILEVKPSIPHQQHGHPTTTTLKGTWTAVHGALVAKFKRGTIAFAYHKELKIDDLCAMPYAPGLIATSASFESGKYVGQRFLLTSDLDKLMRSYD